MIMMRISLLQPLLLHRGRTRVIISNGESKLVRTERRFEFIQNRRGHPRSHWPTGPFCIGM